MHVAEILDREGGVAIMLSGARCQHLLAEAPAFRNQVGLEIGKAESVWSEERRIGIDLIEMRDIHFATLCFCSPRGNTSRR